MQRKRKKLTKKEYLEKTKAIDAENTQIEMIAHVQSLNPRLLSHDKKLELMTLIKTSTVTWEDIRNFYERNHG